MKMGRLMIMLWLCVVGCTAVQSDGSGPGEQGAVQGGDDGTASVPSTTDETSALLGGGDYVCTYICGATGATFSGEFRSPGGACGLAVTACRAHCHSQCALSSVSDD
jgi:hypothetical protein